jgi:3-oxoacyl-[acyl-carrier protein] reductase
MRLQGKRALITGGGRGIGRAYVERFVREGASVVIGDIDEENASATAEELRAAGGDVTFVRIDVSDPASVDAGVAESVQAMGGLDILLNNAALLADWRRDDHSYENLLRVYEVNLHSLWLMTRAALPSLIASGAGRIINQSSTSAFQHVHAPATELDSFSYAQTKRGVIGLTKFSAGQLGHHGITVNAIAPGVVHTAAMNTLDPAALRAIVAQQPIKGDIQPEDITGAAVFFASDEARFCTGQVIVIDGGRFQPVA